MVELKIDPDFQALCPPLTDEEYRILEHSLREEGCRQPLDIWFPTPDASPYILDGHNRYQICLEHAIPFDVAPVEVVTTREEAWDWIIARQMGRRNISEEQKSYLRGKRYNLEKQARGAPEGNTNAEKQMYQSDTFVLASDSEQDKDPEPTRNRLAHEYGVGPATIARDADFAKAMDTVDEHLPGMRQEVLKAKTPQAPKKPTRKQVIDTAKIIGKSAMSLKLGFLKREQWKEYERLEAISLLDTLPTEEHLQIDALLDQPYIPGTEGLNMLRNLQQLPTSRRQTIYTLQASTDPRERSLALTTAAQKAPSPDPQMTKASNAIHAIEDLCRIYRIWIKEFPLEPWIDDIASMQRVLQEQTQQLMAIREDVKAKHEERIHAYVNAG